MRRWAQRSYLALLLVAALACGRGGHETPPAAIRVTDDAGRQVALAQPARRIVSLSPAVTELLFALGAGDRLVGRTTWCDYPPAALAVPSVGDGLSPNVEAVAARQPDLVVLYRSALTATAAGALGRLGIATAVVQQDRLEDVTHAARLLGRLTGREHQADSIATLLAPLLDRAAKTTGAKRGPRVAVVVWDNPLMVVGAGSYLDELVTLAGGANVFHDISAPSAPVALETLARRNPDRIIVLRESSGSESPAFLRRPEWQVIPAIHAGHVVSLTGSIFSRPSPRAAEAVAALQQVLGGARR
jgi:iron complex transport system substrate-binding protein